ALVRFLNTRLQHADEDIDALLGNDSEAQRVVQARRRDLEDVDLRQAREEALHAVSYHDHMDTLQKELDVLRRQLADTHIQADQHRREVQALRRELARSTPVSNATDADLDAQEAQNDQAAHALSLELELAEVREREALIRQELDELHAYLEQVTNQEQQHLNRQLREARELNRILEDQLDEARARLSEARATAHEPCDQEGGLDLAAELANADDSEANRLSQVEERRVLSELAELRVAKAILTEELAEVKVNFGEAQLRQQRFIIHCHRREALLLRAAQPDCNRKTRQQVVQWIEATPLEANVMQ
ncbi:uncharacterized protein MONBRDRAFT_7252, partial [Monosiga brevicollis MX1]